jgi:hypothetical protein
MKKRLSIAVAALLLVGGVVGGFALADPGSDLTAAEESDGTGFVGLDKDAAIALADEQERLWRIASEDGQEFALDASLVVGRVTFDIEQGVVVSAEIETDEPPATTNAPDPVDPDRAAVLVAGLRELVFVDNTFGGGSPFETLLVGTRIGGDSGLELYSLELELIAAALQEGGTVKFIDDPDAETRRLFEAATEGVAVSPDLIAVLTVRDLRLDGDRAEIDLSMWCGSLCGTYLTYEVVAGDSGWDVTGPIGPIAVS